MGSPLNLDDDDEDCEDPLEPDVSMTSTGSRAAAGDR